MSKRQETHLARKGEDTALAVSVSDSDAPMLPVEEMERLGKLRPDAVEWVLKQTETEANHRRLLEQSVLRQRHISGIPGQIFGLLIGLAGVLGGGYVAVHGAPGAGATIASISIGTLAVAFIGRKKTF